MLILTNYVADDEPLVIFEWTMCRWKLNSILNDKSDRTWNEGISREIVIKLSTDEKYWPHIGARGSCQTDTTIVEPLIRAFGVVTTNLKQKVYISVSFILNWRLPCPHTPRLGKCTTAQQYPLLHFRLRCRLRLRLLQLLLLLLLHRRPTMILGDTSGRNTWYEVIELKINWATFIENWSTDHTSSLGALPKPTQ